MQTSKASDTGSYSCPKNYVYSFTMTATDSINGQRLLNASATATCEGRTIELRADSFGELHENTFLNLPNNTLCNITIAAVNHTPASITGVVKANKDCGKVEEAILRDVVLTPIDVSIVGNDDQPIVERLPAEAD